MSTEHDLDDDLRPEYDISELIRAGVRGKYVDRYRAGPILFHVVSDADTEAEDEPVELTAEQEAELEASIAEVKAGNFITAEQLFEQLRRDREEPPFAL